MQNDTSQHTNPIADFFRQTFRRHTGGEYSELLTRGLHGEKGVNKKYPWAYIRLFAILFVLLAVYLLIVRFTLNELFSPTIVVLSSCCFSLPFLLYIYELYPKRGLSFLYVCLAALIGGAASNVLAQILFDAFTYSNAWVKAVYSGVFEELSKAIVTLIIIVVARKNSPMAGFVFGAAVGCGFSLVEDMGYIFLQSNQLTSINLTTVINIAFSRGASALCTHILWTAAVGWAFCQTKKYLRGVTLYPMLIISIGLHICWDLPLPTVGTAVMYAVCVVVVETECYLIVHFGRNKVFAEEDLTACREESNADEDTLSPSDPEYWAHWGRFTLCVAFVLMSVVACIYSSIPFRETYGTETFSSSESFVSFMQDGAALSADGDREYDSSLSESDELSGEYVIQYVTDKVIVGGELCDVTYQYWYTVSHDGISGRDYYYIYNVAVTVGESENYHFLETVYNNGKVYASFFRLTDVVITGYNFESNGDITVFIYDADYVRNLTDPQYAWLFCTLAAILGAAAVCYIGLKLKSREVKKHALLVQSEGECAVVQCPDENENNPNVSEEDERE